MTMSRSTSPEAVPADAPLVALPADIREFQGYSWHASPEQYARAALDAAGVLPLIVPALGPSMTAALDAVDGLLVTGSRTNVHPALYGDEPTPSHEPFDPARDATTLALIRAAVGRGLPVLAVCRGIQELNVAFGGTLATEIQEREGTDDHRMTPSDDPDRRFAIRHPVHVEDGPLREAIGEAPHVNSLHRQAIERLAPGLRVEARAPDGTIEAVSMPDAPGMAIGVQWHPEYWARDGKLPDGAARDEPSWRLFGMWGEAVRTHRARRLARAA